ncbi:hypothetical protein NMG60_11016766 [Bertholletia excelsa]
MEHTHTLMGQRHEQMENIRRLKTRQIGTSGAEPGRCRKHPKHRQSPGVCSVCLRERLSQLSTTSSRGGRGGGGAATAGSSSSSSLSPLSSDSSSSESSPIHYSILTKSRTVAFAPQRREGEKNRGFWSKLLAPRKKKDGGSLHSRTMRERVITTRVR